jgi:S-formylglutathione hydrolase FrmB
MRRALALAALLLLDAATAGAQVFDLVSLDHLNRKLAGRVVDHTHNHGADRRLRSTVLGRPRDLYVYLPPGYDPSVSYPLILFLHSAGLDEHQFLDPRGIRALDAIMCRGEIPPAVVAAPDGTYEGENRLDATHSLWVDGRGGRFADHLVFEVLPYLMQAYSVRPEREAHGVLGLSAGGYGGMAAALKHREAFGAVATLSAPLDLRYDDAEGGYHADFDPATYRVRVAYDPDLVIGIFYGGLRRKRVRRYLGPVYGEDPGVIARVLADNPADLLATTGLRPGELAIYAHFAGEDNYNFDAQARSFAWRAARQGVSVELGCLPHARHSLRYLERAQEPAYRWLGSRLLPPVPR